MRFAPSFTKKGPGRRHKQGRQLSITNSPQSKVALRRLRKALGPDAYKHFLKLPYVKLHFGGI